MVAQVQKTMPTDAGAADLAKELAARRTVVVELERARIAATSGELVVNAMPWAEVSSIIDQDNQRVALASSRTTPFRMTLKAGTYRVTLQHPGVREPRVVLAKVEAKKGTRVSATFPTLTADGFLDRAGFKP